MNRDCDGLLELSKGIAWLKGDQLMPDWVAGSIEEAKFRLALSGMEIEEAPVWEIAGHTFRRWKVRPSSKGEVRADSAL